jgi:ATP-dependent exoDNAse (exonuclease V) beta subunit
MVVFGQRLIAVHDWVLPLVQAKFPVLAVDEYQDLGVALHRIVQRVAFEGGVRLFAVGDADQSIYGFTGADGALLLELAEREMLSGCSSSLTTGLRLASSAPRRWRSAKDVVTARAIPAARR